jgi:CYTH domain-containing protein
MPSSAARLEAIRANRLHRIATKLPQGSVIDTDGRLLNPFTKTKCRLFLAGGPERGSRMTIVRRFLLAPSFARLVRKERGSQRVTEGYFPTQSGRNSHVLVDGGQCHLVLVTPEDGAAPSEERTEVPRAHADALLDVCAGRTVYERTRVSLGNGREALIDRITHPGALDLASVEFEDRDEAATFLAPAWFGPEMTADASFDRRAIALQGVPPVGEVPLSNAALETLLDLLEDRFGRQRFAAAAPAPRRAASDSSVLDALRRLASPDQGAAEAPAEAAEPPRVLTRQNFPVRSEAGQPENPPEAGADADTRIDHVIAGLSQALGNQPAPEPEAQETAPTMPDVERPVTRLRRFGA